MHLGSPSETIATDLFLEPNSGESTILVLAVIVLGTLLLALPQLLRLQRAERIRGLKQGVALPQPDYRSVAAGRPAFLVPIVVVCVVGTATCFLVGYRSESAFTLGLAVWGVAGVVSPAAITGGVALMGRLAQLHSGFEDDQPPANPLED